MKRSDAGKAFDLAAADYAYIEALHEVALREGMDYARRLPIFRQMIERRQALLDAACAFFPHRADRGL